MVWIMNIATGEEKQIPYNEAVPDGWILVYKSESTAPLLDKFSFNWLWVFVALFLLYLYTHKGH